MSEQMDNETRKYIVDGMKFPNAPSNSMTKRKDKPQVNTVPGVKLLKKKESFGAKFRSVFFKESPKEVAQEVWYDIVIPSVKNLFLEMLNNGARSLLLGDNAPRDFIRQKGTSYYYDYTQHSRRPEPSYSRERERPVGRNRYDFTTLKFESRDQAEDVLAELVGAVQRYNVVTVANLYDAIGIGADTIPSDWDYGWTDLRNVTVIGDKYSGFGLTLPRVEPVR